MRCFGSNLFGESLAPGRVTRLGFGFVVDQPLAHIPLLPGSLLLVGPAALLHPKAPRRAGRILYDLLTGHPDRDPGDLVFPVDLTQDLWAWDGSTWAGLGVDLDEAVDAVAVRHRRGEVNGLRYDDLNAEELHALCELSMTSRRTELRRRLRGRTDIEQLDWLSAPPISRATTRSP